MLNWRRKRGGERAAMAAAAAWTPPGRKKRGSPELNQARVKWHQYSVRERERSLPYPRFAASLLLSRQPRNALMHLWPSRFFGYCAHLAFLQPASLTLHSLLPLCSILLLTSPYSSPVLYPSVNVQPLNGLESFRDTHTHVASLCLSLGLVAVEKSDLCR